MKSKKGNKKVVRPLISVHVVHYACSNCGEEKEEVKMCGDCSAPMRVIQVVELYGDEANEYLENLKESQKDVKKEEKINGVQFDESISGSEIGQEDEINVEDEENFELGEIFPDEEEDEQRIYVGDLGDDFEAALDILDQEDDELSEDIENLPEL